MSLAEFSLGALVLFPLLGAAVTVVLPHRARRILGVISAVVTASAAVPVLVAVTAGQIPELILGGWEAPLGIHLRGDGLAAVFTGTSAAVGLILTCYAAVLKESTGTHLAGAESSTSDGQPRWRSAHPGFWPLWLGCWSGLNAVFVSGDLFNLYVGLELVSLTAVALVALGGPGAWEASLRYLFIAVLGSLLFLAGVGLLAATTGTLDLLQVREALRSGPETHTPAVFALCLMSIGLTMKLALLPMHRWLVPAHSGAPSAVSPLLSGLVLKAALVVLLRTWVYTLVPALTEDAGTPDASASLQAMTWLAWLFGALGAAAVVVGSVMALRQTHLKPLVAYSTVAQIGYWVLFLPLLLDPGASALEGEQATALAEDAVAAGALTGSVALAAGHATAKAGLFLAAGFLKDRYGTDEIIVLRGAGAHHPMLILAMGLCAVGLIGLPISLGFTGKWQLATSAVAAEHWWLVAVLAVGTLLSAGYLLRGISPLLMEQEVDDSATSRDTAVTTAQRFGEALVLGLGLLTVGTGLLGAWLGDLMEVGTPW